MQTKIKCYAKINLFLHITGKTQNGFHLLDSMVMFAKNLYDELHITRADKNEITVDGKWAKYLRGQNILAKTLEKFAPIAKDSNFKIKLIKNIPIGAGLGGGSSNAAELIKFIMQHFKCKISNEKLAEIGADVPMFLHRKALYFTGIGEKVHPIKKMPQIYSLIVYPNTVISTHEIFNSNTQI